MKNYKLNESPVGLIGRTTALEANEFIANAADIKVKFLKLVKALGGKQVAIQILKGLA